MSKQYIINLMAANRVGILAAVTTALDELGGNLREMNQSVVSEFFIIILDADFPDHREPHVIVDHLRDVCRAYELDVALREPMQTALQTGRDENCGRFLLTLKGDDRPGAMRRVSSRLAQDAVNIIEIHASRQKTDGSFTAAMELSVPSTLDLVQLQNELEQLGLRVGLSATLEQRGFEHADTQEYGAPHIRSVGNSNVKRSSFSRNAENPF